MFVYRSKRFSLKSSYVIFQFTLVLLFVFSSFATGLCQERRNKQSGFLDLEFTGKKKIAYEDIVKSVTSKAEQFASSQSSGSFQSINFTQDDLNYLAAVHLYCTMRKGACPLIPQALLEMELSSHAASSSSSCQNLPRFWKTWIESDMEKRVEIHLQVVNFAKRNIFKKKHRPKYLKCKSTVSSILPKSASAQSVLKKRYANSSKESQYAQKLVNYIHSINEKVGNIFTETGLSGLYNQ